MEIHQTPETNETPQPRAHWKRRVLLLLAGLLLLLMALILLSGQLLKPLVRESIRDQFIVPIEIGDIGIRIFPRPSFTLNHVFLPDKKGDTLLAADMIHLQLELFPLLKRQVVIPAVGISGARVFLREKNGQWNIRTVLAPAQDRDDSPQFQVAVNRLLTERVFADIHQGDYRYTLDLAGGQLDWNNRREGHRFEPEFYLDSIQIQQGNRMVRLGALALEGALISDGDMGRFTSEKLRIRSGDIRYESGLIAVKTPKGWQFEEPDGHLEGPLEDLHELLAAWMPPLIKELTGDIDMRIHTPGSKGDPTSGKFAGEWTLRRAGITMDGMAPVDRVDGQANVEYDPASGQIAITDLSLKGRYGGDPWLFSGTADYRKALSIAGSLEATLHAEALPATGNITWNGGRLALDLTRLEADLSKKDWPFTALEGRILPEHLTWTQDGHEFELDGPVDIMAAGDFRVSDIKLTADGEEALLSGTIGRNPVTGAWEYELEATADRFTVDGWIEGDDQDDRDDRGDRGDRDDRDEGDEGDDSSEGKTVVSGMLKARVDRFHYKKAVVRDMTLESIVLPGGINLVMSGEVFNGKMDAALDWPTGLTGVLDIRMDDIRLDEGLERLENFDQDFITSQQIEGRTTALATVHLPEDPSRWLHDLEVDVAVQVDDGRLRDMELMENFAGFVKLGELRNLQFSRLMNVFRYRDSTLYIPAMRIESNVADLVIAGTHRNGQAYHYDLRLDGNSVLSRKYNKRSDRADRRDGWLQLFYHIEGSPENWDYRADKEHVRIQLDLSDDLRGQVITRLRERFGPHPLLIRSAQWRKIPEYQRELELPEGSD